MSWYFIGLTEENRKNLAEWLVWDEICIQGLPNTKQKGQSVK